MFMKLLENTFLLIYQFLSILTISSNLQKPETEIFVFYNITFDSIKISTS